MWQWYCFGVMFSVLRPAWHAHHVLHCHFPNIHQCCDGFLSSSIHPSIHPPTSCVAPLVRVSRCHLTHAFAFPPRAVLQMFFDVPLFLKFVADCRGVGINVPVIPGVMVIQAYGGFKRMTAFCKSRVPAEIHAALDAVKDSEEKVKEVGIEIGTAMCKALLEGGAPGLHFYTLNLENVTNGILKNLGLFKE